MPQTAFTTIRLREMTSKTAVLDWAGVAVFKKAYRIYQGAATA